MGATGCIFHVIDKRPLVYILGRGQPACQLILSDGKKAVIALLPSGLKSYPHLNSYIDVRVWRADRQKRCIFNGHHHVLAQTVEILHCTSFEPRYGVKGMVFSERCAEPPVLVYTFQPPGAVAEDVDRALDVESWEQGIRGSFVPDMDKILNSVDDEEDDDDGSNDTEDFEEYDSLEPPEQPVKPLIERARSISVPVPAPRKSSPLDNVDYQGWPGFVYHCTPATKKECLREMLFGGNSAQNYRDLDVGSILYLYNITGKELTGPFIATTGVGNHFPQAWGGRYKYQCRIKEIVGFAPVTRICSLPTIRAIHSGKWGRLTEDQQKRMTEFFVGAPASGAPFDAAAARAKLEREEQQRVDEINQTRNQGYVVALTQYRLDLENFGKRMTEREEAIAKRKDEAALALRERAVAKELMRMRVQNYLTHFDQIGSTLSLESSVRAKEADSPPHVKFTDEPGGFCSRGDGIDFSAITELCGHDLEVSTKKGVLGAKGFVTLHVLSSIRVLLRELLKDAGDPLDLKDALDAIFDTLNDSAVSTFGRRTIVGCVISYGAFDFVEGKDAQAFFEKLAAFMTIEQDEVRKPQGAEWRWRALCKGLEKLRFASRDRNLPRVSVEAPTIDFEEDNFEINQDLQCPITQELFRDPVTIQGADFAVEPTSPEGRDEKNASLADEDSDDGMAELLGLSDEIDTRKTVSDEIKPVEVIYPSCVPDEILGNAREMAKTFVEEHPVTAHYRNEDFKRLKTKLVRSLLMGDFKGGEFEPGRPFARDNPSRAKALGTLVKEMLNQYIFAADKKLRQLGEDVLTDKVIPFLGDHDTQAAFEALAKAPGKWSPKLKHDANAAKRLATEFKDAVKSCSQQVARFASFMARQVEGFHVEATDSSLGMLKTEDKEKRVVYITIGNDDLAMQFEREEKPKVELFEEHYEMLVQAYCTTQSNSKLFYDNTNSKILCRLFTLTARYNLFGEMKGGYQASVTAETMSVLDKTFGVTHECFASPFNRQMGSFNSLFFETDMFFGSYGSFYDFHPRSGSYEVNPPFDPDTIVKMFQHVESLLTESNDDPLSFVIVIPALGEAERACDRMGVYISRIEKIVEAKFYKGMQHTNNKRFGGTASLENEFIGWQANHQTMVIVAQNRPAQMKWPATDENIKELRDAFLTFPDTVFLKESKTRAGNGVLRDGRTLNFPTVGGAGGAASLGRGGLIGQIDVGINKEDEKKIRKKLTEYCRKEVGKELYAETAQSIMSTSIELPPFWGVKNSSPSTRVPIDWFSDRSEGDDLTFVNCLKKSGDVINLIAGLKSQAKAKPAGDTGKGPNLAAIVEEEEAMRKRKNATRGQRGAYASAALRADVAPFESQKSKSQSQLKAAAAPLKYKPPPPLLVPSQVSQRPQAPLPVDTSVDDVTNNLTC